MRRVFHLAVLWLLFFILFICTSAVRYTMFEEIDTASTDLGINAQVSPHLINIARLFQIFFGGIIVVLTVGIILTLAIPGSPYDQYRYPPGGGDYL